MKKTIFQFLDDTAARCGDKVGFIENDRTATFSQLKEGAEKIACEIVRKGLRKEGVVLLFEKSIACIEAFFGVAYSGNFYTVIAPDMPAARVEKIMGTLEPKLILTDRAHREQAEKLAGEIPVLIYEECLETEADLIALEERKQRVLSTDVLYVLFTSGSSGMPKGVVTSHRAVAEYLDTVRADYDLDETTITLSQTPFYFVMSILDTYLTVLNGSCTHVVPDSFYLFVGPLVKYIEDNKINTLSWVPSALCAVSRMGALNYADLSCVRKVVFGGEVMPMIEMNKWREAWPQIVFINGYGSTEATDGSLYYVLNRSFGDDEVLPMGKPFGNTEVYLVDENDKPVTDNSVAELLVSSTALAYGYYKEPELTAQVFVQNPLHSNYPDIVYRTGDLVRRNEYGEIVYVGRKDNQIKKMGRRIELGEIDTQASVVEGIRECCCLFSQETKRIWIFYEGTAEKHQVRKDLAGLLPVYMLPDKYVRLDEMPHNVNGKIDRARLKEMMTK